MRLSDIVVLPIHTEGLPRVIQEAMILKRPVISTPVGGVTDLIQHGETGLIVGVEDVEGFARNIEYLFTNNSYAEKLAENAYKYVHDNFSVNQHVAMVKDAFEEQLDKTNPAKDESKRV